MEQLRKQYWDKVGRKEWIEQHYPSRLAKSLDGVFDYKQVKFGNLKKGEGDIVVIDLKVKDWLKDYVTPENYLGHILGIDRIETKGIFTNVYFSKKFFAESIADILSSNPEEYKALQEKLNKELAEHGYLSKNSKIK